jgi:hypothetical protein
MPIKRYRSEGIVAMLRQVEVGVVNAEAANPQLDRPTFRKLSFVVIRLTLPPALYYLVHLYSRL